MTKEEIRLIVSRMTLEEKVSLTTGKDAWSTRELPRLGVPSVRVSDGPLVAELNREQA